MNDTLRNFWTDEEAATAIEYGLIAGLVSIAIIAGATLLGDGLSGLFSRIAATRIGSFTF